MRLILLFVSAVLCAAVVNPSAGMAEDYPWCANYGYDMGGTNCGFVSREQCMAALSGNGGYCAQNAQYRPSASQPAQRRNHRSN
jgi:hypothetical protein